MKATEAAALLTICAAYDNRKPDADAARAWALALDEWRFEDCRDAIVAHYRTSRDWIMPADVIAGVRIVRSKRHRDFMSLTAYGYLLPPADLADDPAAEQQWLHEITQRICNGEITHPDELEARGELKPRNIAALGQVGRAMPTAARMTTDTTADRADAGELTNESATIAVEGEV